MLSRRVLKMEEILYDVEIRKTGSKFLGRIYSDVDGVKEFKNERIDRLLRDIIFDMQLAYDEFSNRSGDFEGLEELRHF
jgi:signal recognition particle subunit SEC65